MVAADILRAFVEEVEQPGPETPYTLPLEGEPQGQPQRELVSVDPVYPADRPDTIDGARERIGAALAGYLAQDAPAHLLLIRAAPGTGKTYAGVRTAEDLAAQGRRVLYAGPRHDFFQDVLAIAERPELWYEWLPRQVEDAEKGKPQTCGYVEPLNKWLQKGYDAMQFCSGICGWDYVNQGCPYHAQKKVGAPIIFGQHQHVTGGHPLRFHVVIGDEDPTGAFLFPWEIPSERIIPRGMAAGAPMTAVLERLQALAERQTEIGGPALLDELGGAETVAQAIAELRLRLDAEALAPSIHQVDDVERADFFHLPRLAWLLGREAEAALSGSGYPHRVLLEKGHLVLLLRKPLSDMLPPHIVWLDATGEPHVYEALFGRPVEVVDATPKLRGRVRQCWQRANNKTTLGKAAAADQLGQQVQRIIERQGYRSPALVTFKSLTGDEQADDSEAVRNLRSLPSLHFYGARGANGLQEHDALFVAGTPQPAVPAMIRRAAMIYQERMTAFDDRWHSALRPYALVRHDRATGAPYSSAYPISGFWGDPDLQAVLWSLREAELIQAAHRVRPVLKPADIWLLTNVPLDALPPDRLLSIADSMGIPEGVEVFKFNRALRVAEELAWERYLAAGRPVPVRSTDLAERCRLDAQTAREYVQALRQHHEWLTHEQCLELFPDDLEPRRGRGRPALAAHCPAVVRDYEERRKLRL